MSDSWEVSVAVRLASVAITLQCKQPCDERSILALHEACARLHAAIARSNRQADGVTLVVDMDTRCTTCISVARHSDLFGVLAKLDGAGDDKAGDGRVDTRILRESHAPAWHIVNALALELDAASVPPHRANAATLAHLLEVRSRCSFVHVAQRLTPGQLP